MTKTPEMPIQTQPNEQLSHQIFEAIGSSKARLIGAVCVAATLVGPNVATATEKSVSLSGPTEVAMTAEAQNTVSKNIDLDEILYGKATVVADTRINETNQPGHEAKACRWYKKAWNYYVNEYGQKVRRMDSNVYACKDKDSPTGYVKRGGGFSGRDCHNVVIPMINKKPARRVIKAPIIKGRVVEVSSFNTSFTLHSEATARVNCVSNAGSSEAAARGVGDQSVSLKNVLKNVAEYRAFMGNVNVDTKNSVLISLRDKMSSSAYAKVTCVDKPLPPSPPPPTPPENPKPPTPPKNAPPVIDMVKPQHMLVNGILQICGYVSDPDGLGDIKGMPTITFSGDINAVSDVYAGDETGEYCKDAKAGTVVGEATATGVVTDKAGNQAQDTINWPVVSDNPGNPGAF